ncbi:tetratricopeptide repeat-containing sensor histidine kinase [Lutibacter sp. A80]|uniref:tetratricopeptide repeat-containing sensor histidine kinase n=1 Tax=Lutibacter sp. A80 TaxID=2918453 RepID=UPI001F0648A4|nr:tetratricopeptide repeat-containing sensor histidine kinase [Lutibacter sp. A80]UMB59644.1 tetratricopeptide repeat-containing sensor histidine kinase [Lutibacter sp. A80]
MKLFNQNKTTYFLLFFLCFIIKTLYAQDYNDSIKRKLVIAKNDTVKIQLLIDYGNAIYYSSIDSSIVYYKKALQLSKQLKNKKLEALCLLNLGYSLDDKGLYKEALTYYTKAINSYKSVNDEQGIARCYNYIGYSFSYLNSVDKSIEYYLKSLNIFKKLNDSIGIADVNNGFGSLYYDNENYKKAEKNYLVSENIYRKINSKEGLISVYINLGNAISEQGRIDEGLDYYFKAIEISKKVKDIEALAICYNSIGDCYLIKKEHTKALDYLNKAFKITDSMAFKSLKPLILKNIANTKLSLKEYDSVIIYVNRSLKASEGLPYLYFEYENYNYLSSAYEAKGDYKKALLNHKLYKKNSDSVLKSRKYEQLAKLDVIYEIEEKENTITLLENNKEIAALESKNKLAVIYVLIIFSIFFLAFIYFLYQQKKERKKAFNLLLLEKEKAEESDRLKSAFLANMSHEIRTPMNAIMGFSNFLKNTNLEIQKRNHFIDIINISGERLMSIINDIIDISKIESNQLKIESKKFNFELVLSEIIEIHKETNRLVAKKELVFKMFPSQTMLNKFIVSDQNRFSQIINNLINNAVKFSPNKGSIEIGYYLKHYKNKKYIEFYVKDEGNGIPKSKFKLIFDRFFQAGDGDFKVGNGLGLSICKGLVTLLKGKIWLESEENKGTTFYFTLPY